MTAAAPALAAVSPSPHWYPTSVGHLAAELRRLDLMIRHQVVRLRRLQPECDPLQGLVISDGEVDALLARPAGLPRWLEEAAVGEDDDFLAAAVARAAAEIDEAVAESRRRGVDLRLASLAARCGLDRTDCDLLLIALAPEIEPRYERLYAFLQDDVSRRRPSVDLALSLVAPGLEGKLAARARFGATAPLRRHRLLTLVAEPGQSPPPLPSRIVMSEDGLLDYLSGGTEPDARLNGLAETIGVTGSRRLDRLGLASDDVARLEALAAGGLPPGGLVVHICGLTEGDRRAAAVGIAAACARDVIAVDGAAVAAKAEAEARTVVELVCRDALLHDCVLVWEGFDALLADDRAGLLRSVLDAATVPALTILAGERQWAARSGLPRAPVMALTLPRPSVSARRELWRDHLGAATLNDDELTMLADGFRFAGAEIRDTVRIAADRARWKGAVATDSRLGGLMAAARARTVHELSTLCQRIVPRARFEDLVLPADRLTQLHELSAAARFRSHFHDDWGFARRLSYGRGLAALFSGPSGTGKTMAAEVIAGWLGGDLLKIDLSAVVSKYIGETEKNLSRVFTEAEICNAILFFDEADALFGKRGEVRDSHDRYANIETAYLLQRLEAYDGLAILATNLAANLDGAFIRRLAVVVDFPFPGAAERSRIWKGIFPPETPLEPGLNLDRFAHGLDLAGGNIRSVALLAAALAAAEGGAVGHRHILHAARREYQKQGRIISIADGEFD